MNIGSIPHVTAHHTAAHHAVSGDDINPHAKHIKKSKESTKTPSHTCPIKDHLHATQHIATADDRNENIKHMKKKDKQSNKLPIESPKDPSLSSLSNTH